MTDIVTRLRNGPAPLIDPNLNDEAADEIERLRAALRNANSQAEHFEREWYLRGDRIENDEALLRQALEALESVTKIAELKGWRIAGSVLVVIAALRERLTKEN